MVYFRVKILGEERSDVQEQVLVSPNMFFETAHNIDIFNLVKKIPVQLQGQLSKIQLESVAKLADKSENLKKTLEGRRIRNSIALAQNTMRQKQKV